MKLKPKLMDGRPGTPGAIGPADFLAIELICSIVYPFSGVQPHSRHAQ